MIPLSNRAQLAGLTLVEMLAALGISALLLGLSMPTFRTLRAEVALRGATSQVMAALQLARRTALSTGQTVTLCPSPDGQRCAFGAGEWWMFSNAAGGSAARRESGEALLRRWTLPSGVEVGGTRGYAAFLARTSAASTVTFQFCHPARPALRPAIIVSQTGRARLSYPDRASSSAPSSCH